MGNNYLFLIFSFVITLIQAPKPPNIRIINFGRYYNEENHYDITVFKNEIFGFEFSVIRGGCGYWNHLNDTVLKESNYVRFLNRSTWDYISEAYEKQLEAAKNSTNDRESIIPMDGGSSNYYELFKAIDGGSQPQILYFTYSCGFRIYKKVTVAIWICDEIYKDQCINNQTAKCVYNRENNNCISKTLCDKVENVSKSSCENAVTSTPSLTKCSYEKSEEGSNTQEKCIIKKLCSESLTEEECSSAEPISPKTSKCVYDKIQNICTEEKKFCYEIEDGATEDICSSAKVTEENKTCIFNNETKFCSEVYYIMKNDSGNNKQNILLLCFLYLLLFI